MAAVTVHPSPPAATAVLTAKVARAAPAAIVTIRVVGPGLQPGVSSEMSTARSAAGAGCARTANCSWVPSVTASVTAAIATTGVLASGAAFKHPAPMPITSAPARTAARATVAALRFDLVSTAESACRGPIAPSPSQLSTTMTAFLEGSPSTY